MGQLGGYSYTELEDGWSIETYTSHYKDPTQHKIIHDCKGDGPSAAPVGYHLHYTASDKCRGCKKVPPDEVRGFLNMLNWER